MDSPARAAGVDYLPLVLTHPRKNWKGQRAVHVPPLNMLVRSADGKRQVELQDRVLTWFRQKLLDEPAAPVPEFRPNRRVFAEELRVRLVLSGAGLRVHYTTDGSAPTPAGPVWQGPLRLTETTVVKAMAVGDGFGPSGVATAVFRKGKLPPEIVPPPAVLRAKVGVPFRTAFAARGEAPVVWRLVAHYRPANIIRYKGGFADFTGLVFDAKTATLSGTPARAGAYTLEVQAAWKAGGLADVRTTVVHVAP